MATPHPAFLSFVLSHWRWSVARKQKSVKENPDHTKVAFTMLPIFMLSASVGVMLVGETTAIAMADGTFTGNTVKRSSSIGRLFAFIFQARVFQSRRSGS